MTEPRIIACPHCHRRNRLPADKPASVAHCGGCKQLLFEGRPIELSASNLDAHLQSDMTLLVDFWAPWCGPCLTMAPHFEAAAMAMPLQAQSLKINNDNAQIQNPTIIIVNIPSVLVFIDGKEINRFTGAWSSNLSIR